MNNIFIGFLAGLLTAMGGALKDSPYEGFYPLKLFRSIIVGTIGGTLSLYFTRNVILTFCFSGYFERFFVEGYKILRAQMPGKFKLKNASDLGKYWGFRKRDDILR